MKLVERMKSNVSHLNVCDIHYKETDSIQITNETISWQGEPESE